MRTPHIVLFVFGLTLNSIGGVARAADAAPAAPAGETMKSTQAGVEKPAAASEAADLYKAIDELWTRRDDPEAFRAMDEKIRAGMQAHGDEAAMLWRAGRWQFWRADSNDDKTTRRNLAKLGYELAERAVAKDPNSVDARYWTAVNYGIYGEALGIITAIAEGVEGKFRTALDFALAHQRGYEYGGAVGALGRYYASLPWPKRDRKKAIEVLRGALKDYPHNVRARVYLAEALLDSGEAKQAMAVLEEAIAATPGAYDAPEERLAQKMAKALKPRIEKELP